LTKWQIAGLIPINIPLLLAYSRSGNNNLVRRVAVDALIVVSGLKDLAITKYLANLCLYDNDSFVRYHTSKSLMYFIGLCVNQIDNSSHESIRKSTLKAQLQLIVELWTPD
jgi:hypothetical protein